MKKDKPSTEERKKIKENLQTLKNELQIGKIDDFVNFDAKKNVPKPNKNNKKRQFLGKRKRLKNKKHNLVNQEPQEPVEQPQKINKKKIALGIGALVLITGAFLLYKKFKKK
jgi:hypothetical protein